MSQAAVSARISSLEDALGVQLFQRSGRGIRITEPGEEVRAAAVRAVEAALAIENLAAALCGVEQGRLRLAASNILSTGRLPSWLAGFAAEHPDIDVELRLDNMGGALSALDTGEVDCALIGALPERDPSRETLDLGRDELVLVVASHHPLARSADPLQDLTRHRYLARGRGSATEDLARRVLGPRYAVGPIEQMPQGSLQQALLAGSGYAVMPAMAVEGHVAAGRLHVIDRPGRPVRQPATAVRRRGSSIPALDAWWAFLRRQVRGPLRQVELTGRGRDRARATVGKPGQPSGRGPSTRQGRRIYP
jgi:DNA-binding transcriptional LysR family regulator